MDFKTTNDRGKKRSFQNDTLFSFFKKKNLEENLDQINESAEVVEPNNPPNANPNVSSSLADFPETNDIGLLMNNQV